MSLRSSLFLLLAAVVFPMAAWAQPFFGGGVSSFTPEISVVNTGVLNDVQATVSPDRRYVTLTMRPTHSQLLALQEFTINAPLASGFVGGVQFNGNVPAPVGDFGAINEPVILTPGRGRFIFQQRGMTRILIR